MDLREQLFAQRAVAELFTVDFDIEGDVPICLKHKDCVLVMFHNNDTKSQNLMNVWNQAAQQSIGPIFACCDLSRNRKVELAFNRMVGWAGVSKIPFILSYHNGYPADRYKGSPDVQSIIDYGLMMTNKLSYDNHDTFDIVERVAIKETKTVPIDIFDNFGGVKVQPRVSNVKTSKLPDIPKNKVYKIVPLYK